MHLSKDRSSNAVGKHYLEELKSADRKRQELIMKLQGIIDELESTPDVRLSYSGFPYGIFERSIRGVLDLMEKVVGWLIERREKDRRSR